METFIYVIQAKQHYVQTSCCANRLSKKHRFCCAKCRRRTSDWPSCIGYDQSIGWSTLYLRTCTECSSNQSYLALLHADPRRPRVRQMMPVLSHVWRAGALTYLYRIPIRPIYANPVVFAIELRLSRSNIPHVVTTPEHGAHHMRNIRLTLLCRGPAKVHTIYQ